MGGESERHAHAHVQTRRRTCSDVSANPAARGADTVRASASNRRRRKVHMMMNTRANVHSASNEHADQKVEPYPRKGEPMRDLPCVCACVCVCMRACVATHREQP